jgi:hypothetical protein
MGCDAENFASAPRATNSATAITAPARRVVGGRGSGGADSGVHEAVIAVQLARSVPDEAGARVDLTAFSRRGDNLRRLPNPEFLDADSRFKIRDR